MPIFNSCTECVDRPGLLHNRTPDCSPVSWVWMHGGPHSWTCCSFDSQATWVIDVCGLFVDMLPMNESTYNQALADVRLSGAEIKCLYCMYLIHKQYNYEYNGCLVKKYSLFLQGIDVLEWQFANICIPIVLNTGLDERCKAHCPTVWWLGAYEGMSLPWIGTTNIRGCPLGLQETTQSIWLCNGMPPRRCR